MEVIDVPPSPVTNNTENRWRSVGKADAETGLKSPFF